MTQHPFMTIGALASASGATVATIRYYEDIGLLPPARRSDKAQRLYEPSAIQRVAFVRRCREFGFSIDQVRQLVDLVGAPARPCTEVRDLAAEQLQAVRQKLSELRALEATLQSAIHGCDASCSDGCAPSCSIVVELAQARGPAAGTPCKVAGGPAGRHDPVGTWLGSAPVLTTPEDASPRTEGRLRRISR